MWDVSSFHRWLLCHAGSTPDTNYMHKQYILIRDVKLEFFSKSKLGSKKSIKNRNSNSACSTFVKFVLTVSDGQFRNRFDSNYERFLLEIGRHGHTTIRSDTSTPCASAPVTFIIIPGRSGERSYFVQWVAHFIQGSTCRPLATHQLARPFYDWWIRRNVSMIDSWDSCYHCLLVGGGECGVISC